MHTACWPAAGRAERKCWAAWRSSPEPRISDNCCGRSSTLAASCGDRDRMCSLPAVLRVACRGLVTERCPKDQTKCWRCMPARSSLHLSCYAAKCGRGRRLPSGLRELGGTGSPRLGDPITQCHRHPSTRYAPAIHPTEQASSTAPPPERGTTLSRYCQPEVLSATLVTAVQRRGFWIDILFPRNTGIQPIRTARLF